MRSTRLIRCFSILTLFALLGGCATSGGAGDEAVGVEAKREVDGLAAKLGPLLPAETRAMLKLRLDQIDADLAQMPEELRQTLDLEVDDSEELEHLAHQRPVFFALATTGASEHLRHAWLSVPQTDPEALPASLHVRVLLPSDAPAKLAEEFEAYCDGDGSTSTLCKTPSRRVATQTHLSVDLYPFVDDQVATAFFDDLSSLEEAPKSPLLNRVTPALHRFLRSDAPFSIYAPGGALSTFYATLGAAEFRSMVGRIPPDRLWRFLFKAQGLDFGSMLDDPNSADFEDVALIFDMVSPPKKEGALTAPAPRLRVDALRTYTEHGRAVWANREQTDDSLRANVATPFFEASWDLRADQILADANAPTWVEGSFKGRATQNFERWADDLDRYLRERRFGYLMPFLYNPGGLMKALSAHSDAAEMREDMADMMALAPKMVPQLSRLLGASKLSVSAGLGKDGSLANLSELQLALIAEWPYRLFDEPNALVSAIETMGQQIGGDDGPDFAFQLAETKGGGHRLVFTLNTTVTPLDEPAGDAPRWQAHLTPARLGDQFYELRRSFGSLADYIHIANYGRATHDVTRVEFGAEQLAAPSKLTGFDEAGFEPIASEDAWKGCMAHARYQYGVIVEALETATPENRPELIGNIYDLTAADAEGCEARFPEHADKFRWARGGWLHWQATRFARAYDYAGARSKARRGCDLGYDAACTLREELDTLSSFTALAPQRHHRVQLSPEDTATFLLTDEGVFFDAEKIVDADMVRSAPDKAALAIVEKIAGEAKAVQLMADAMTDASLLTALAGAFDAGGLGTKVGVMENRSVYRVRVLNVNGPKADSETPVRLHVGGDGITLFDRGKAIPAIEGCPSDGPTVCLSIEPREVQARWRAVQAAWQAGEVEESYMLLDGIFAAYQTHKLYEAAAALHQSYPDQRTIRISLADGMPVAAAVRMAVVNLWQLRGAPFADAEAMREARIDKKRRRLLQMFSHPVLVEAP